MRKKVIRKALDQVKGILEERNLKRKVVSSKERMVTGVIQPRIVKRMQLVPMKDSLNVIITKTREKNQTRTLCLL